MEEYTMCKKCILHSKVPGVVINEDGLCTACHDYKPGKDQKVDDMVQKRTNQMFTKKMYKLFEEVKQQHNIYDAVVLYSGGKDSTFLLDMMKNKYKLNVIAFAVMHPLVPERASMNVDEITRKLKVDVVKLNMDDSIHKRFMKFGLLNAHKYNFDIESIGCRLCGFFYKWSAEKFAIKMGIPLILDGKDRSQSETPLLGDGKTIYEMYQQGKRPDDPLHQMFLDALGDEVRGSIFDLTFDKDEKVRFPRWISPFTFIDYNFKDNIEKMHEIGSDEEKFNSIFTNCSAIHFFAYFTIKKYNCIPYIRMWSNEVRKEYPFLMQTNLEVSKVKALDRETMLKVMDEYKHLILYIVDNNVRKTNITDEIVAEMKQMCQVSCELYGAKTVDILLDKILAINELADNFEIDLKQI